VRPIGKSCDIGAYEFDPKNPGKGFPDTASCQCSTATPAGTPIRRKITPTPQVACQRVNQNPPCNCNGFCD
jgi:hypothetical protein